jgi:hypothetical protein
MILTPGPHGNFGAIYDKPYPIVVTCRAIAMCIHQVVIKRFDLYRYAKGLAQVVCKQEVVRDVVLDPDVNPVSLVANEAIYIYNISPVLFQPIEQLV